MVTTSVRLPKDLLDELEKISKEEGLDRGAIIRRFLTGSLKEYRVKKAMEMYREGKVSLWKAAEMAGISYREALEQLKLRNIPFRYDVEDLEADINWATK